MNTDDTAGDLAAIIFNALASSDLPVTFEHVLPGQFVYRATFDNGITIGASFSGVTGEYLACYKRGSEVEFTEFLAASIFHKLVDMYGRENNLPVNLYEAFYA